MSMAPCLRKNDVIANLLGDGRWILIQGFAYFLEGFSKNYGSNWKKG